MATYLYRLGRFAYRKRRWVVAAWLTLLLVIGTSATLFMGKLTDTFTLPGTATQETLDRLDEVFPDASGGTGSVVFESVSGEPLSAQQKDAIVSALDQIKGEYQITDLINPFAQQKEMDSATIDVSAAQLEIDDNDRQLADGRRLLQEASLELENGRAELEKNEAILTQAKQEYAQGQRDLVAGRTELEAGQAEYLQGLSEFQQGESAFAQGERELQEGQREYDAAIAELESQRQLFDTTRTVAAAVDPILPEGLIRTQLSEVLATINGYEQEAAQAASDLELGRTELESQRPVLDDARRQLAGARQQLDAGKAELIAGEQELADAAVQIADGENQLAEGRIQLEQGEAEFISGSTEIKEAEKQLADARIELVLGQRQADATKGLRFVSEDGTTAISQLTFADSAEALSAGERDGLITTLDRVKDSGIDVFYSSEISTAFSEIFGIGEIVGIVVAGIILFLMMGTFVAAGLPILMAIIGVAAGVGGTLALSSLIDMASITPILALMLGLAVGIDYTLFIAYRHRTQLLQGMEIEKSIGLALGTSGNAVVFAGLTVVIALSALVIPGLPFLSVLGLSAAATVALAVIVSITLTPAMLGFIGNRLAPRRVRQRHTSVTRISTSRFSWGDLVSKHPWTATVLSIGLLILVALPAGSLRTALPDGGQEPYGSSAQQAYETTSEKFGDGYNGSMIALVDLPATDSESQAMEILLDVSDRIRPLENVVAVLPLEINEDRSAGLLHIVPAEGPAAESTEALVRQIRQDDTVIENETGASVNLAGNVVANIDVSEKVTAALVPYLAIVIGLSLILLLLVFRSLLVPLLATAGFLISLAAAFGAAVAVYQWGWLGGIFDVHSPGPIMSFLPILLTGILFGLAMDYQVFLVSAMREAYSHGHKPIDAIRSGFRSVAPVVTAAALIMISVFAGFIHSGLTMIRPIGFALAVGVFADAFIVRMTLTPALMTLLGDKAWYLPRWLNRLLPDVDVEGAKLSRDQSEVIGASQAGRRAESLSS